MQEERAPDNRINKITHWSFAGGILGILTLIFLDMPFLSESSSAILNFSASFSGFFLMAPWSFTSPFGSALGPVSLFDLLWLNFAGGMVAAVAGFTLTDRVMHGWVFSSIPSSRNAAMMLLFSGLLVIAGSIAALAQLLVTMSQTAVIIFGIKYFVGWAVFAELLIGPAIIILASVTLRNIPK